MILKTSAYMCRWTFSKKISGRKNNCMKVFGHRTERSVFRRKCFLRVVKGAFQVFSATLWKKMIKVNFTFCGLFRTVCVFFWSERKVSQGFQNHKLSVQMKKVARIFLTHLLSENIFSFWAEKLGVLAKKYRHGCQNCNRRTFKNFWGKRIFLKLNMIANFFGLRDEENWAFIQKNFFRVFTTGIRASKEKFWGKMISLSKEVLFFCYHFWSLSNFFFFFAKFFSQVCQTTDQRAERNKMGKLPWKNCFFNQFWIWGKKNLVFQQSSEAWFSKP